MKALNTNCDMCIQGIQSFRILSSSILEKSNKLIMTNHLAALSGNLGGNMFRAYIFKLSCKHDNTVRAKYEHKVNTIHFHHFYNFKFTLYNICFTGMTPQRVII